MVVAHILFAMEAFVLKGYSNVVTNSVGVLRNGTLFCFLLKKGKDSPGVFGCFGFGSVGSGIFY